MSEEIYQPEISDETVQHLVDRFDVDKWNENDLNVCAKTKRWTFIWGWWHFNIEVHPMLRWQWRYKRTR
jgi:hypothetical protein